MRAETAILLLRPNAEWSLPSGSTSVIDIVWHDNTQPITQPELDEMLAKPEPEPKPLTTEEKLSMAGISVNELKTLLGLK